MRVFHIATIAGLLSITAAPAFAHIGIGAAAGFASGFMHPFSGLDHVLAMIAVGLFASRCGGRAAWLLPAAFVGVMALGGVFGYSGLALPYVEPAIALSVVGMGALLMLDIRLPLPAATLLVGVFALFHGHAHGTEGMYLPSFASYGLGFVAATALLHASGIALNRGLDRADIRIGQLARRGAGLGGCVAGAILLAG